MYQYDDPTATSSLPTPAAAGTPGYFTDGNPATGQAATILQADFMNTVMLELLNVVRGAGLTPSKTSYNQLLLAIQGIAAGDVAGNAAGYLTQAVANNLYATASQLTSLANSLANYATTSALNAAIASEHATVAATYLAVANAGSTVNGYMLGSTAQAPQVLTGSRSLGTTYVNSTGRPILVNFSWAASTGSTGAYAYVNGAEAATCVAVANYSQGTMSFVVPNGLSYSISNPGNVASLVWTETR